MASNVARVLVILFALLAGAASPKPSTGPRYPARAQSSCGDVTISITESRDGVLALRATFDTRVCPTIEPKARLVTESATLEPSEIRQPQPGTVTIAFTSSPKYGDVELQLQSAPSEAFRLVIRDGRIVDLLTAKPF